MRTSLSATFVSAMYLASAGSAFAAGGYIQASSEEDQIVAFLQTLTDGFTTPFPDANTYTGP